MSGGASVVRVCFVCSANVCRSPTAEGIFRSLVAGAGLVSRFAIDSAGTHARAGGTAPDPRSARTAASHGITLAGSSRAFGVEDYERFDWIVAMDGSNEADLHAWAPDEAARARVVRLRRFDPDAEGPDVPDPYLGPGDGFERVFEIVERACRHLLEEIRPDRRGPSER